MTPRRPGARLPRPVAASRFAQVGGPSGLRLDAMLIASKAAFARSGSEKGAAGKITFGKLVRLPAAAPRVSMPLIRARSRRAAIRGMDCGPASALASVTPGPQDRHRLPLRAISQRLRRSILGFGRAGAGLSGPAPVRNMSSFQRP